jgi:hypothetical protein
VIARAVWRQRGNLVADASSGIQRIQKVLIEMNVQLSSVLSDLSGNGAQKDWTGQAAVDRPST